MCGRFSRSRPIKDYAGYYRADPTQSDFPSYNVCPGDDVLAVVAEADHSRHLTWLHWGFIPFWSKGPDSRFSMINARAETLPEKPAYRTAFRKHRCIIVADGFYEWKNTAEGKQPYFIQLKSGEPIGFAGLWDHWEAEDGNQQINSTTLITTQANDIMKPIHDRMPAIIPIEKTDQWLDPEVTGTKELSSLLDLSSNELIEAWPVSKRVNSPAHQGPELIRPL
jgi:putative SOS response-associated peptidase YedK